MQVNLDDIELRFEVHPGIGIKFIRQYDERHTVLTDLAPYSLRARLFALEILFDHIDVRGDIVEDAMRAYSWWPLNDPPQEYVDRARAIDWEDNMEVGRETEARLLPVIFASPGLPERKKELWSIFSKVIEDDRDGVLWALGSFYDEASIREYLKLIGNVDRKGAGATGEMNIFAQSLGRWVWSGWPLSQLESIYAEVTHDQEEGNIVWGDLVEAVVRWSLMVNRGMSFYKRDGI